jgi:hypothetical protein
MVIESTLLRDDFLSVRAHLPAQYIYNVIVHTGNFEPIMSRIFHACAYVDGSVVVVVVVYQKKKEVYKRLQHFETETTKGSFDFLFYFFFLLSYCEPVHVDFADRTSTVHSCQVMVVRGRLLNVDIEK